MIVITKILYFRSKVAQLNAAHMLELLGMYAESKGRFKIGFCYPNIYAQSFLKCKKYLII